MRILFSILLFLTSCATTNYYDKAAMSWRGGSVVALEKVWGPPDVKMKAPYGNYYYIYSTTLRNNSPSGGYRLLPAVSDKKIVQVNVPVNSLGNKSPALSCTTTFTVNSADTILSVRSTGNNCVATLRLKKSLENPKKVDVD